MTASNREVFHFDAGNAVLRIGTAGNEGDISVRDSNDTEVFQFDAGNAVLRVGNTGNEGDIIVRNDDGAEVIHLNGSTGDIILSNADAAEHFDLAEAVEAAPGTVMVLNATGKLELASNPYDKKVVGVVAGAGNYRPGIVLDHRNSAAQRVPISVLGKVTCKADASFGSIEVGDLLTTSPTAGHAMKASDPRLAFGAVIGKALSPLQRRLRAGGRAHYPAVRRCSMASLKSIMGCVGIDTSGSVSVLRRLFGFRRSLVPTDGVATTINQVSLLQKIQGIQSKHINLNVIRVGFDLLSDEDLGLEKLDYAILRIHEIYRPVSLGIGRVEHYVISSADADGADNLGSEDEADELSDDWSVYNNGIDAFVVRNISDDDFVGISPVGGDCDKPSKRDGLVAGEIGRQFDAVRAPSPTRLVTSWI